MDQLLAKVDGSSTTTTGQRRGSILDSLQAGAENLFNKAAKFIDDANTPSTTQTTQTTTSPYGVTTTTTTTTTVVKSTTTDPTAAAAASNGQSITDKISSTLSSLQANISGSTPATTTTNTNTGNAIVDKFNELKVNAQAAYQNRDVTAEMVDRKVTEAEENYNSRNSELGKKVETGSRQLENKATGFLDQVTAAVQQVGQAIDRRTSVAGNPGLLSQINSGAEALRRSADGILDSGTLGAGAAGGLADPIKRLSTSQPPAAPAVAAAASVPGFQAAHVLPTAPGPPVTSAPANAVASGSGTSSSAELGGAGTGIVPSHPAVVEGGSGDKPITTTTNEVPHSAVV